MKKQFKNKRAFTLIELLIVIAIIGILFIVLVSKVDFATDKAKASGVQTDFRSFQMAFEQVAKENAGFNTFGWDTGDTNGDRVRNAYDKGDNGVGGGIAQNGIQDGSEVFVGSKTYGEDWTGVYTLIKPGTNVLDAEAIFALESAINANLDPKLYITIDNDGVITMANQARDPWKNEYHGRYLSNAAADNLDRGVIIMYSDGANGKNGSADGIAGGLVNITTPGSNVDGKDDYAIATVYTYANGYGEVKSITYGFSNNQTFNDAKDVPVTPVGQAPGVVVPSPVNPDDETVALPTENPSGDLQDYFDAEGWSSIKALANARLSKDDYKNKYGISPGDKIVSNGITYVLVDLGLDNNCDGIIDEEEQKGYDGFVFMYKHSTPLKMNSTGTNAGGYAASELAPQVEALYDNLADSALKAAIKEVTITCNDGNANYTATHTYTAHMFLASYKEIGSTSNLTGTYNAEGTCFDLFANGNSSRARFMSTVNISSAWWLRSAYSGNTSGFQYISIHGYNGGIIADSTFDIVPAFVIG